MQQNHKKSQVLYKSLRMQKRRAAFGRTPFVVLVRSADPLHKHIFRDAVAVQIRDQGKLLEAL